MKLFIAALLVSALPLSAAASDPTASGTDTFDICLFSGTPTAEVRVEEIKYIKVGKGSYGSVRDILPVFARRAQETGANAVINYAGSQRFGFWPWRLVRPVTRGTAVKLHNDSSLSCAEMGGASVREVIASNKAP
ncbi:MAG: hypothetical protein ACKVK5_09980 [Pseudomonadales bacterium]